MTRILKLLVVFLIMLLAGCGTQDGASTDSGDDDVSDDPIVTDVAAVQVDANPRAIGLGETSTITVSLYNEGGQLIEESNTVTFSLDNRDVASIVPIGTTSTGTLTETLTASDVAGAVTITATSGSESDSIDVQVVGEEAVAETITVVANPESVTVGGTANVRATVYDTDAELMPDGTVVNFSLNNTGLGSIVSAATTVNGVAQATFSASDTEVGTAIVTAESGVASGTDNIQVFAAAAGSIEFVSATPQVVVLQGAGGTEVAEVVFLVKDVNGDPVAGSVDVGLTLSGPNGGEYLTAASASTVDGYVTTNLASGTIPGPATITATVIDTPSLTTSSGVIAIGGGVPSAGHFSLSTGAKNLEGLAYDGVTANITARIADRYGNYNVLEGTSVSFYSECGAIDRSVSLSAIGEGLVVFRTQAPDPEDVDINDPAVNCYLCEVENARIENYEALIGPLGPSNPRDGLCTIIAVVDGEEEFTDANADGLYNSGETFEDSYDDIHLEKDDDNFDIEPAYADGVPYDRVFEDLIVDRNEDGEFDGLNGVWDANKRISKPMRLLITGEPVLSLSTSSVTVADSASETVYFSVHDVNYNSPVAGTSVSVSSDVGSISGTTDINLLDTSAPGPIVYWVTITDDSPEDEDPAEVGTLDISIDWVEGYSSSYSIPVTVN